MSRRTVCTSWYPRLGATAPLVEHLMDAGYGHRLMLSHDYSVPKARYGAEVQETRHQANPDGYTFISRRVLPRLQALGASDQDIHQ